MPVNSSLPRREALRYARSMADDHYFSASPASAEKLRRIRVTLAGSEVELTTAGGVFSPDHIDSGTAVLLASTPPPPPPPPPRETPPPRHRTPPPQRATGGGGETHGGAGAGGRAAGRAGGQ